MFSGFLVDFVSSPVISGFTSAASVTITVSQIKNLLGMTVTRKSHLPAILKTFVRFFKFYGEGAHWGKSKIVLQ